jgi:predicted RNA binding protein YcfA (HicA-like mRNA interferase family)
MKPRNIAINELSQNGYYLKRNGANHDIFYNDQTKSIIPLKRHDFDESDLRYIRKEIKQNQDRRG